MTPGDALLLLVATLQCHTTSIDIPERRETLAYTVCVKVEVSPLKEEQKPVIAVAPVKPIETHTPQIKRKATRGCKKRWYWKNHRKRWRCVR